MQMLILVMDLLNPRILHLVSLHSQGKEYHSEEKDQASWDSSIEEAAAPRPQVRTVLKVQNLDKHETSLPNPYW